MNGHIIIVFLAFIFIALWNRKWALFAGFALLVWMFSFRTNEVPDTAIYEWMYNDPLSRLDVNEIGYLYLGIGFKMLTGAEFWAFNIFQVGLCLLLWYIATINLLSRKENLGILFLIFVSFFGLFYMGITIRNCLSELLVLCGLSFFLKLDGIKKYIGYAGCVLLAMLIHRSAAFFFILIPLIKVRFSKRTYLRVFVICVVIWLLSGSALSRWLVGFVSSSVTSSKLDYYLTEGSVPSLLSLQILINWVISYFAIKSLPFIDLEYRYIYNYFLKINTLGLLTMSIIWSISTSYRFYNMFFFFNYVLIYLMIFHNNRIRRIKDQRILSILISVVYFVILIHSFPIMLFY